MHPPRLSRTRLYFTSSVYILGVISVLICLLRQHYDEAGKSLGEGGAPAEGDLCGLCALPVTHPAGQPRTGAAHRRYRCCISTSCVWKPDPPPQHASTVRTPKAAVLMDACAVVGVDRRVTHYAHESGTVTV